jgi:hypothetical protein
MNKPTILTTLLLLSWSSLLAQIKNDIIHLLDSKKEVQVKEVGLTTIRYSYPNESAVYSVNRHLVSKIEFASGREELFTSPYKKVKGLDNFRDVYLSFSTEDVSGLFPKGELFSKATGVTTLSSITNVKNRAVDKLKAEASMVGANVVLIGTMYQRGNENGGENNPGNSTQTAFSGIGYSTENLDIEKSKSKLEGKLFHHYQTHRLNRNSWSPERTISTKYDENNKPLMFALDRIFEKEGELFVSTSHIPSKTKAFKVISVDEKAVILMERNEKVTINYYLISEQNKYFKNLANRVVLQEKRPG